MRFASRPRISLACLAAIAAACQGTESPTPPSSYQPSLPPQVAELVISEPPVTIGVGETALLHAWTQAENVGRIRPANPIVWSGGDDAVATVATIENDSVSSPDGTVPGVDFWARLHGVAPGSFTVRATSGDKSSLVRITVGAPAASITISPASLTLDASLCEVRRLAVSLIDASGNRLSGRKLLWTSSDSHVAYASPARPTDTTHAAEIGGQDAGTATITASTGLISATIPVTITRRADPNLWRNCM